MLIKNRLSKREKEMAIMNMNKKYPQPPKIPGMSTEADESVKGDWLEGNLVRQTNDAILFHYAKQRRDIWLPKSKCAAQFTGQQTVIVFVPDWIQKSRNL